MSATTKNKMRKCNSILLNFFTVIFFSFNFIRISIYLSIQLNCLAATSTHCTGTLLCSCDCEVSTTWLGRMIVDAKSHVLAIGNDAVAHLQHSQIWNVPQLGCVRVWADAKIALMQFSSCFLPFLTSPIPPTGVQ